MGTFTRNRPKCLLPVAEETLLSRMLASLSRSGVDRAVLTVGHCADQVRAAVGSEPPLPVDFIDNPDYREGSLLSLWHTREYLGVDDVLVMDADVLFPQVLLDRLIASTHSSCALLDGRVQGTGEEMILCASTGRVWDIVRRRAGEALHPPPGVDEFDQVGESVGFFKLSQQHAAVLAGLLERAVAAGRRSDEYESVFPAFFRQCVIGYERVDDLPWTEIDFQADVERARAEILPAIENLATEAV